MAKAAFRDNGRCRNIECSVSTQQLHERRGSKHDPVDQIYRRSAGNLSVCVYLNHGFPSWLDSEEKAWHLTIISIKDAAGAAPIKKSVMHTQSTK